MSISCLDVYDILATYDFRSDVILQYFSWAEYDISRPVIPKVEIGDVFTAISNCGNSERLDWLKGLEAEGIRYYCLPQFISPWLLFVIFFLRV